MNNNLKETNLETDIAFIQNNNDGLLAVDCRGSKDFAVVCSRETGIFGKEDVMVKKNISKDEAAKLIEALTLFVNQN